MTPRSRKPALRGARGLLVALVLASFGAAASADVDVVAIVHEENPVEAVTLQELRLLYSLYRRSWDGGVRVVLILPVETSPAMLFLADDLFRGRAPKEIADYYRTAVFQQRIAVPPQTASDHVAVALVRSERGAIALVEREHATDASGVRILEILRK